MRRRRLVMFASLLASLSFMGLVGCEDAKTETGDTVTCAEGTELFNGTCRPAAELCPDGQVYSGGQCRAEGIVGGGLECGAGTIPNAAGTSCVPDPDDQIACGNGTVEQNGRCVPDPDAQIECGPGTIEDDGECVALNPCDEGEVFDGMDCIDPPTCQSGTLEDANGNCVPVNPLDDIEIAEGDENNDPLIGDGTPAAFQLGAQGTPVILGGVIEAPRDLVVEGEGVTPALEPDFDGFVFSGGKGQRISIEGTAVGAPDVAWGVFFAGDDAAEVPYQRFAVPITSGNTRREYVLPREGAYVIRVSTFNNVQLETFGTGINFNGDADASYVLAVTALAPESPETETTAAFSWSGDARGLAGLSHLEVNVEAGTVLDLQFIVDSGLVLGEALLTSPDFANFYGFLEPGVTRITVPEGGLLITADYLVSFDLSTSFTITGLPVPITTIPDLNGGPTTGELASSGGLEGYRFEVTAPTRVHAEVAPGVDSRASVGVLVADADFNAVGVGSGPAPDFGEGPASVDAFLATPGTYYIAVVDLGRPGNFTGAYTFELSTSSMTVPAFGGGDGALTFGTDRNQTTGALVGQAWYFLSLAEGGDLTITGTPTMDVALEIFGEGQIAERGVYNPSNAADDFADAEAETLTGRVPPGFVLFHVFNTDMTSLAGGVELVASLGDPLEGSILEVEPNDTQAGAQVLTSDPALDAPVTVAGDLEQDAVGAKDFYTFTVANPSTVTITTMPGLLGGADTTLTLLNAMGAELAFNDDAPGLGVYSELSEIAVPAGTFTVEVAAYEGLLGAAIGGDYFLTIQITEEFSACAPGFAACNGANIEVCNAVGDGFDASPCVQGCEVVAGVGAICTADTELDVDNNDQAVGADALVLNNDGVYAIDGTIGLGDDSGFTDLVDWYSFEQTASGFVNISFEANPRGPAGFLPDYVEVYAAGDLSAPIAAARYDYALDVPPFIDGLWLPMGSAYFIKVGSDGGFFGAFGGYRLVIEHLSTVCEPGAGVCADATVFAACAVDGLSEVMVTCGFGCGVVDGAAGCTVLTEEEPNDIAADGTQLGTIALETTSSMDGSITSVLPDLDSDWYRFTLDTTAVVTLETSQPADSAVFDTEIWLYDGMEAQLANDDDGGEGNYSKIGPIGLPPGDYFVRVEHYSTTLGTSGDYRLSITTQTPVCEIGAAMCDGDNLITCADGLEEITTACGSCSEASGAPICLPAAEALMLPAMVSGETTSLDESVFYTFAVSEDDITNAVQFDIVLTPSVEDSRMYICTEEGVASTCGYFDGNVGVGDQGFEGQEDSILGFTPPAAGTYYIVVSFWTGVGDTYDLSVSVAP